MKALWRLLGYMRNYKMNVLLNVLCNILMVIFSIISIPVLTPFLQLMFQQVPLVTEKPVWSWDFKGLEQNFYYQLSEIIRHYGAERAMVYVCISLASIFFLLNLFRYLSLFFIAPMRNGIVRDLRQQLIEKTMSLPIGFFSEERKGDLMSRVTADVQEIEWSILNVIEALVREPLMMFGALAFMIYISPPLTLFVLLLIFATAFLVGGIGRSLKRVSAKVQEKLGDVVSVLDETLGGLRIIKGFNADKYQIQKFNKENNHYRQLLTQALRRRDLASPLSEFMGVSIVCILIWYGFRQVNSKAIEASQFLAFLFAFYRVIDPAKSFSQAYYNIQKGLAALERVQHILDAKNTILEPTVPKPLTALEQGIEYKNVSFYYRDAEQLVLDNISLYLPKGKMIALVGASGAGKSTIADLLPRFYDVNEGAILLDGVDIRDYHTRDLRNLMGIVSQEAVLFNDSIYNNIVFGMEGADMAAVEAAAKAANAHEFIIASEDGYHTNIGDRGNKLSGGQRQRLTIARALLRNPAILILDEATSALDSESEKLVQQALAELMKNRTSLVIAHRLATIQHADEILVMKDGRIIERGTNEQLLAQGGEYRKLVALQAL